jgi:hypothetical protein
MSRAKPPQRHLSRGAQSCPYASKVAVTIGIRSKVVVLQGPHAYANRLTRGFYGFGRAAFSEPFSEQSTTGREYVACAIGWWSPGTFAWGAAL